MDAFWPRAILHVDMDAFYASVEQHDHPEYRGRPVIVGGTPEERGVVSTASYEARKFGVHSAMPAAAARRLCPNGIFLPGNHRRYAEVSRAIQAIFARFTPLVQPLSLDEAFLDCTGSQRLFGPPAAIARQIKDAVRAETGLTASVGAAATLFVAKIASDLEKPDGLTLIPAEETQARLDPLPVGKIWGVGAAAEKKLHALGIATVGELRRWPEETLVANLGPAFGARLYQLARGQDDREVAAAPEPEKSISNETTFPRDVTALGALEQCLRDLAGQVGRRARAAGLCGRTVQVKVRYADFSLATRRVTLPRGTASSDAIFRAAWELLKGRTECGRRPARLLGVGLENLAPDGGGAGANGAMGAPGGAAPGGLFADEEADAAAARAEKIEKIERASDKIIARLGEGAVLRGSRLPGPGGKR